MKPLLAALLSLMSTSAFPSISDVDRYVTEKIGDHLIPGLALVVIRNGEVVHRRGFGELDPTRPIIIGSLSKAITATAVMTLVEDGKIDLDAPMQRYLPEVRFDDPAMGAVTTRQLLHQTSGLPAHAPRAGTRNALLVSHVEALRSTRLIAAPGERHVYSSPNYQLLGRIIEVVSGESFGTYVKRRILDPLQMTSSSVTGAEHAAPGHNLWWGVAGPSTYRWEPGRLPTASIVASADDLSRFLLSQLGIGPQILSAESRALLHRGVGEAEHSSYAYAMGWREGTTAGVPSLWHGGALPSYRGALVLLPQSRSGVIVLTNMSSMFADHTREIAAGVVALTEQRPLPAGMRPLRQIYLIIAAASFLLLGFAALQLVRAVRRPREAVGKTWSIVVFDVLLPLAAIIALPILLHVSYVAIWEGAPDIVVTVGLAMLLGLLGAGLKLAKRR